MDSLVMVVLCISLAGIVATDLQNNNASCFRNVTNMKNEIVSADTYCTDKTPCLIKCCGENEVLTGKRRCTNIKELNYTMLKESNIKLDFSDLKIYDSYIKDIDVTAKTFQKFILQNSEFLKNEECSFQWPSRNNFRYILENGDFAGFACHEPWFEMKALKFCVDLMVRITNGSRYTSRHDYYIEITPPDNSENTSNQGNFACVGMLISVFFLFLILLVYSVLPKLRNLSGMLLMVYVATLLIAYLTKAIVIIMEEYNTRESCKVISPVLTFLFISMFLWLNVLSYDIWWMCRGMRLKREVNRQGEVVKFLWYCLFVWGVTGLVTMAEVIMDNIDKSKWCSFIPPKFYACLGIDAVNLRYLYAPIAVLTLVNIVLFLMTVYNIWLSQKTLRNFQSSTSNQNNQIRFCLYLKLSSLMGLSWILEVIQSVIDSNTIPFWLYVIINSYNALIGVPIFILFVCNKKTLTMLCKCFKINDKFINNLSLKSIRTRSTSSRPSTNKGSYSKTRITEQSEIDMTEMSVETK